VINEEDYICFPGRVVKYYPEDQTADVQLCAEKVYSNAENNLSLFTRGIVPHMPVHTPSGGGWSMTMPIKTGDTCILFFSQIGYDHWLFNDKDTGGTLVGNPEPHLMRSFDVNDGYALLGLNTLKRAISTYHPENSEWRGPDSSLQVIRLKPDHHIEIESSVQVTVIAPHVQVNCDTMTASVGTLAEVTCPQVNLISATSIACTTPLFSISGNLLVGGAIGSGGAPVPASGATVSGPLVSDSTGTFTNVLSGGTSVNAHVHSNPEGGSTGPF